MVRLRPTESLALVMLTNASYLEATFSERSQHPHIEARPRVNAKELGS